MPTLTPQRQMLVHHLGEEIAVAPFDEVDDRADLLDALSRLMDRLVAGGFGTLERMSHRIELFLCQAP